MSLNTVFQAISSYFKLFQAISSYFKLFQAISSYLRILYKLRVFIVKTILFTLKYQDKKHYAYVTWTTRPCYTPILFNPFHPKNPPAFFGMFHNSSKK
jgi:hypothetical protein